MLRVLPVVVVNSSRMGIIHVPARYKGFELISTSACKTLLHTFREYRKFRLFRVLFLSPRTIYIRNESQYRAASHIILKHDPANMIRYPLPMTSLGRSPRINIP